MFKRWLATLLVLLLLAPSAYAADGSITTPDGGKKLDTDTRTTGEGTVHRQRVQMPDVTGTTVTFNDASDVATVELAGNKGAAVTVATGTCEAILKAEVSTDNATSWVPAVFGNSSTGIPSELLSLDGSHDAESRSILYPGPITHVRVSSDTFTGGSCNVTVRATTTNPVVVAYGTDVGGTALHPLTMMDSTPTGTEMAQLMRCIGCTSTGGTSAADNTVWVYGTTAVTPAGYVYDTTPDAPTDGRVGAARMNVNRDIHAALVGPDGTGVVEDNNGVLVTLTTVASTQGYNRRVASAIESGLALSIDGNGAGTVMWEIAGSCTCTIVFEGTTDPGGSPVYFAVPAVRQDTRQIISSLTNPTGAVRGYFKQTGFRKFQVRVSAHTSGTPDLRLELSNGNSGIDPTEIVCTESQAISTASSGDLELIAAVTGEHIYVCGWSLIAGGTTNVQLKDGTGTNCNSGSPVNRTGAYPLTAQAGLVDRASKGTTITKTTGTGRAICLNNSSAVQISGVINYARF